MRRLLPIAILLLALVLYGALAQGTWENRKQVRSAIPAGYVVPSKFSRILALGHQGLHADFLFLKTATFIGGRIGDRVFLNEDDWQYVIRSLEVISALDPYFADPYMLAEGLIAWDAGKPEEANRLLSRGMEARTWDWQLPFFIGFNYFYFLKDYETAADYIMAAAQLPGSPAYLGNLAARLAYYGGKSKTALLFLQEMLAGTDDALLRSRLETRLLALERAVVIEEALDVFKEKEGRSPEKMSELVTLGYLDEIPADPYGGKWGILKNGRIFSTSKFVEESSTNEPHKNQENSNQN